jgi:hypothetical protein
MYFIDYFNIVFDILKPGLWKLPEGVKRPVWGFSAVDPKGIACLKGRAGIRLSRSICSGADHPAAQNLTGAGGLPPRGCAAQTRLEHGYPNLSPNFKRGFL